MTVTVTENHPVFNLPDELVGSISSRLHLLSPDVARVIDAILPYLPRAFETGYGTVTISIRNGTVTVEVTTSIRL